MNKTPTIRSLGWLIGLILLFSWHVQAESNPPGPNTPISLTATAGVPFKYQLPALLPYISTIYTSPQLPGNGLDVSYETLPPSIVGTPDATGVMNLTINANLTVNGQPESAWMAITITVLPPTPISLTATAGVPFTYELPVLIHETNAGYTSSQLPANGLGLSYDTYPPSISGTPNATGVMNLTINASNISNGQAHRAWVPIRITVMAPTPISLTATVGVPFTYHIPVLLTPNNTFYTSPQLPANGLSTSYSTYPPSIVGTPLSSGVMNLTINASNGKPESAWKPIIITVIDAPPVPPVPPLNLTAIVGVPFQKTMPLLVPLDSLFTYDLTGLPANGLHIELGRPPGIQGVPLTSGVMNLTLVNTTVRRTAWKPIIITVIDAPPTPPVPPLNLTAIVGVPFQKTMPLLVPLDSLFTYDLTGLPANGLHIELGRPPGIQGVPLTSGVMNLTLVNTTVRRTAWKPIIITVNPAPGSALTLLAPTYNCTTGAFHFNTSGGDGSPITYFAIGITGPTTNPDQFVDTELRTVADAQPLHLQATQNGVTVSYIWDIRAQCPASPPPSGSTLSLLAPTYDCATGAFRFNTSGGNGSPIEFFAIGVTGWTTNPNQFVDTALRTAADAQPLTLLARQNGVTVSYVWDIRAQCPVSPPPSGSTLTLLAPTYNCATGAFHFNTSGGDGSPITYFAFGITSPTTNPDQFVDTELRTVNDVQPFLLHATQNGTSVTYLWNLKAACGRARLSAPEPERSLRVKLLGNPVVGDRVHIEVSGAEDQPLVVTLINQQGRPVSEARIVKATAVERLELKLSRSAGVHLLQVSTLDQTKVVRVVKAD
ncbi:T9SS type A sorting domain-containing protein [Spirosoma koreense]